MSPDAPTADSREVRIDLPEGAINGDLTVPADAVGMVVFAHGSGSSRRSPRNSFVARVLQGAGLATLLMDLLTAEEEQVDMVTREHRFNVALLARRLLAASRWLEEREDLRELRLGYFGSSTGAAAAIVAAAQREDIRAIVARGGRVDLAEDTLERFSAPILLIVGANDPQVLALNQEAMKHIRAEVELQVIPGAGHLFQGPGQLEEVARLAARFFRRHLRR